VFEEMDRFRKRLAEGKVCLGAGITLTDSSVVEAIAPALDFVWIDLEHTHQSYETVLSHLIAARSGGVAALVRVRGSEVPHIKPVLDIGAGGIIVPQIRSAEEARSVVAACRYAPMGSRGFGPRRAAAYGRDAGARWMQEANAKLFVGVQVENAEALNEIDTIAAIEGLDSIVLGPYDLSISLEHPGELKHPEVASAIDHIIATARKHHKFVGTGMAASASDAQDFIARGVQWLQCGDDYGYMVAHLDGLMQEIRRVRGVKDAPTSRR
jgi:2-keto-3-deoxy-L-rhamnonate aldolase RhmA